MKNRIINKNELSNKPIGCILGSNADDGRYQYKNIVVGFVDEQKIYVRTNLTQIQFNKFCQGKLNDSELEKCL